MNILDVLTTAQQPARARAAAFAARLDEHLAGLPDDASRAEFCERQAIKWVGEYELWAQAVDSGRIKIKAGSPTAFDYQHTIAAINERKARYAALVAA